jgi:hypothetical protein
MVRFPFAIANDDGCNQIGFVQHSPIAVRKAIAEFSSFMNGAGGFGRAVAADAAGK